MFSILNLSAPHLPPPDSLSGTVEHLDGFTFLLCGGEGGGEEALEAVAQPEVRAVHAGVQVCSKSRGVKDVCEN